MSEDTKESIIIASIITAIIAILLIVYGNTGSGFFRNLMVFVVGVIIGTPLAMLSKLIGSFFTNNVFFKYIYFALGASLGIAFASQFFSNKIETSFISQCTRTYGASKSVCECTYNKFDEKYDDKLESLLKSGFDTNSTEFMIKSIKECK